MVESKVRKEKLYLDTSIISAYSDPREPEKQEQTKQFLEKAKDNNLFISGLVLRELEGIKDHARIEVTKELLKNYLRLPFSEDVTSLSEQYISFGIIPSAHEEDALHIAYAVVNNIDCIVSWNFTHIVKRSTRRKVNAVNEINGFDPIEIIAPLEF